MTTSEDARRSGPRPHQSPELRGDSSTDLNIIIVNWNTRELLAACLRSLPAATDGLRCDTVVVDNDSRDGSVAMLRQDFPTVRVIESGGNLGFGRACNLALADLPGEAALILNPDTTCPAGSITQLVGLLRAQPDAAAVGPALSDAEGRPVASFGDFPRLRHHLCGWLDPTARWLPRRWRDAGLGRLPDFDSCRRVDYVKGACLLLDSAAVGRVGLFDERFFMYFEETDWCWRAREAGYGIYLCPQVTVVHHEGQAAAQASRFSLRQFQLSYRLWLAKHRGDAQVPFYRGLQWCEYGSKALWRRLATGDRGRNRRLAADHAYRAQLQLEGEIEAPPPDRPDPPDSDEG